MIHTFVIGCDELPDRKQAIQTHLKQMDVPFTFVRSVYGRAWGLQTVREYDPGKRISPGHVGLCLGHWICWQVAQNVVHDDNSWVLFLEDDAVLPDGWKNRLRELLIDLDKRMPDCEFCFVGLCESEPHVWHKVTERIGGGDSRLCKLNDPFGTHAYIVRRKSLAKLIDCVAVAERNMDQQLFERALKPNKVKWCAVLPTLVTQRTFDYTGKGKTEWQPSCIDDQPDELPKYPSLSADEQDVKRLLGADVPDPPTPELYAATMNLIDPLPCLYRGEFFDEPGKAENGRTIPVSLCARLNKACHTRLNVRVRAPRLSMDQENVVDAVACQHCDLRTEMASSSIRPRLGLPEGHFNPSMLMFNRKLILATRDSWGHSRVSLWELTNTKTDWTGQWSVSHIGSHASDHSYAPRLEDPRLFTMPGDDGKPVLCSAFNLPDAYPPKWVRVGYVKFAPDLSGITETRVFNSPMDRLYEKNWVPFYAWDERYRRGYPSGWSHGLCWVYGTKPQHVVIGENETWKTPNDLPWTGGVIRGGAAPVLMDYQQIDKFWHGEKWVYYHFFHGALKRMQGTVYTVGCSVFEADPPFRILRQSTIPLVWPDLPAVDEDVVKRYVVWPGGAVYHAGAWHLALGVDDSFVRIVRIPSEQVESVLNSVPEQSGSSMTSLRDTPLAMGIPSTEVI